MRLHPDALLAVIDLQNIFGQPDSPWFAPRFAEILTPITQLRQAFAGRTAFTRFVAPEQPRGVWRDYYTRWPFALQPADAETYQLIEGYRDSEAPVIDATTFGKWTPELAELVGGSGELVLAGVSTDCCVLSTALAAADAGVRVLIAEQACAGVDDASHQHALAVLHLYGPLIEVVPVAELVAAAEANRS